ncbi:MAG: hypothetical protein JJU27_07080 [Gammaproteobacteria bacterium]|nr:hypothetical protein [Gammaproteobacteria bacterium]
MICRILSTLLLIAFAAGSAVGDESRRTITHEDLWLMPRVGAPAVSPDGRYAVVSVVGPAYDSDEQASHLWLITVDGSEPPRQLTFARGRP